LRRLFLFFLLLALVRVLSGCSADEPPTIPRGEYPPPVTNPPIEPPPVEEASDPIPDSLYRALIAQFKLGPLPATPYPNNNRYNPDRIRLGRLLFFDPILGGESAPWVKSAAGKDPYRYRASDMACGTCHQPQFGFADNRKLGAGVGGGSGDLDLVGPDRVVPAFSIVSGKMLGVEPRNSMTILNTGLNGRLSIRSTANSFQFMDGRVIEGLVTQCGFPPVDRDEMAGDAFGVRAPGDSLFGVAVFDSLRRRLTQIPAYFEMFQQAFPEDNIQVPDDVKPDRILKAVSAYERELITPDSRYDRFVKGNWSVFTKQEREGFELFFTKGSCGNCHRGPMLCDYTFRCQGVGDDYPAGFAGKNGQGGDWGMFPDGDPSIPRLTDGKYFFRVVTIRNVEVTGPYFHSGSAATLEDAVEFYNRGGQGPKDISDATLAAVGATRDAAIHPLGLTNDEIAAIVAFMKTTTAPVAPNRDGIELTKVPERVPSGLVPPGVPTPAGPGPFYP